MAMCGPLCDTQKIALILQAILSHLNLAQAAFDSKAPTVMCKGMLRRFSAFGGKVLPSLVNVPLILVLLYQA